MRLHVLQHDPLENEGLIRDWADGRGVTLRRTRMFAGDALPVPSEVDGVVVLGGAMNVYQYAEYPWLYREKTFLLDRLEAGLPMLGICLGAQLLADVLGVPVRRNPVPEQGWWPVQWSEAARQRPPFDAEPPETMVFHWHEDTFRMPVGATLLASSAACRHQAFEYAGGRVLGLQFHLEWTADMIRALLNGAGGVRPEAFPDSVQSADDMMAHAENESASCRALLDRLLDALFLSDRYIG